MRTREDRSTPASDLLRAEHRLVETEIDRLEQVVKYPGGNLVGDVRQALTRIQGLSRMHFMREEDVLYPYLRAGLPELLAQLDEQHAYTREVEGHLAELIESIRGEPDARQVTELVRFSLELADVIQHHIVEEEDQLLRLADARLSSAEQAALAARMKASDAILRVSVSGGDIGADG